VAHKRENARRIGLLMVVLAVAVTACGEDSEGGGGGPVEPEQSQASQQSQAAAQPGEVACGRAFQLPAPGELRLTGRFARRVAADKQIVSGTVEITAEKALRGVAAAAADAFLVRDGRVVTTPLPQDAVGVRWEPAAGEKKTVPVVASLLSCEPGGEPLAAGDYELYASFVLTPNDGAPTTAYGGPWPLTVE
jgi:hypothetical protein